jgi:HemY protein
MIRVLFFLIVVGGLSLAVAWLADRPGDVVITWQGLRIETSLMVTGAAIVAVLLLAALLFSLVRALLRSPLALANRLRHRRGARAYEAISNGLIAVGSGDVVAARRFAAEVDRIAGGEPLALLLAAQAAQLSGDREAAERTFRTMASRPDTKTLGLHGLYVEARRRDDHASARAYAEEAARTAPALSWAGRAVLEFRCATGDWTGALALLERSRNAIDKAIYRRQRAVMLTAHALATEDTDREAAKASALEAAKLAPTLVPAAALAGRMLAEAGELRRAARILSKAWRANPHPELAQTYAELRFGDAARDRLARIEGLAKKTPGHIEGRLALARAALDAREFKKARAALASYLSVPTKRVALLMAELERAEHNDEGRAREWMARALNSAPDPQWTADGHVSDRWQPASPITGRLDAFEWRVPLTGMVAAPVIEPLLPNEPAMPPTVPVPAEMSQPSDAPEPREAEQKPHEKDDTAAEHSAAPPPVRRQNRRSQSKPAPVIPLVHAPDDPGPEAVEEAEEPPEEQSGGWRKIFE